MQDIDFTSNIQDLANSINLGNTTLIYDNLKDFSSRKVIVENIIRDVISSEKFTVDINLEEVNVETEVLERFIIELIPRLKAIGGNIVITNNSILSSEFLNKNNI